MTATLPRPTKGGTSRIGVGPLKPDEMQLKIVSSLCEREVTMKEFKAARTSLRRKDTDYYDALAASNQLDGNAPERIMLSILVAWKAGEL